MSAEDTPERLGSGAMFDGIAPRYDLLNRLMSLGIDGSWRKKAVSGLGLEGTQRVLDLATGTADLAIQIAERHPDTSVVGLDPSEGMLAVGKDKVTGAGLDARVSLVLGDAQKLPFEDQSFNGISMAFGIRNVPDRDLALAEMARVLLPGGRLAILELSEPRSGFFGFFARLWVHHVVPRLGSLLSGSREYLYLQKSIAAFPPAEQFADRIRQAGLTVREVVPLTFGVAHLYLAERP